MTYKNKTQAEYLRQWRWKLGIQKPRAVWLAEKAMERQKRAEEKATRAEARRIEFEARRIASLERKREQSKAWRLANPERYKKLTRDWRIRNRDKRRADKKARRAAKRKSLRSELMLAQRSRCAYCRSKLDSSAHLDHIIAVSKGGSNARSNFQLTCPTCNLSKSAKHPVDFAREIGFLI